jgi:hypothetical protein
MLFIRIGRHSDLLANGPGICSPLGSFVIVDPQSGCQRSNLVYFTEQACACQGEDSPLKAFSPIPLFDEKMVFSIAWHFRQP